MTTLLNESVAIISMSDILWNPPDDSQFVNICLHRSFDEQNKYSFESKYAKRIDKYSKICKHCVQLLFCSSLPAIKLNDISLLSSPYINVNP